jgi:hypothetical protein
LGWAAKGGIDALPLKYLYPALPEFGIDPALLAVIRAANSCNYPTEEFHFYFWRFYPNFTAC